MKKFIKVIIFLIILSLCINGVAEITERKSSLERYEDFFNQEEDFDVLFFGSSHMMNGIYPMDLYNDYGIISYNMAVSDGKTIGDYYQLLLSSEYTTPKLVVVDLFMLRTNATCGNAASVHNQLDLYPISYTKFLAIKDIVVNGKSDGDLTEAGSISILDAEIEFMFPFSMYHSRWNELTADDFKMESTYEKGAYSLVNVATPLELGNYETAQVYDEEETINMKYLRKMIEYCQENDIEILLTYIPNVGTNLDFSCVKYGQVIADEYGVNYLNYEELNLVNNNIDLYNSKDIGSSHVNVSGARKVTSYMGQYIMDHYDIEDHRDDEEYSFWEEDYDEYIDYKISNLYDNRENLNNYLMLLYDEEDIEYEITLSADCEIEEDSVFEQLLENLDNNYVIDDEDFEDNDYTVHIVTYDSRTGELNDDVWF